MRDDLQELLRLSAQKTAAKTPKEREAMFRARGEGWARAENLWPKPKFKIVDGVKVYEIYEDYCAD